MPRIRPLPPDVVSQIQSSKSITSLQSVVISLVENSLDAGATTIAVSVDLSRGDCIVEDNGSGIAPVEFGEHGGLCQFYHTSKLSSICPDGTHGANGMHLASLGTLSLLSITALHEDHPQHTTLIVHHGKPIARYDPAPASHYLPPTSKHGTRVTVRDLFGKFPVRVKQRAIQADSSAGNEKRWQEIKVGIVSLLLAWPRYCAVRLQDSQNDSRTVTLSGSPPTALTERHLDQIAGKSVRFDVRDRLSILSQALLTPKISSRGWVPVSASTSTLSIKGLICIRPAPSRQCQFLSIGIHPCSTSSGHNELYDTINKTFASSTFGLVDDRVNHQEPPNKDERSRGAHPGAIEHTSGQLRLRKGVDRYPMYIVQVNFRDVQRNMEIFGRAEERSMKTVIDVLEAMTRQWLAANHFQPKKTRLRKERLQGRPKALSSPSKLQANGPASKMPLEGSVPLSQKRTATTEGAFMSTHRRVCTRRVPTEAATLKPPSISRPRIDFSSWTRIKSGRQSFYDQLEDPSRSNKNQSITQANTLLDLPILETEELLPHGQASTKKVFAGSGNHCGDNVANVLDTTARPSTVGGLSSLQPEESRITSTERATADNIAVWADPKSGRAFKINARTGAVLPSYSRQKNSAAQPVDLCVHPTQVATVHDGGLRLQRPATVARPPEGPDVSTNNSWLPGFLLEWENPVFTRQAEERIPFAAGESMCLDLDQVAGRECAGEARATNFHNSAGSVQGKISKAMLERATVIQQVDRKFILCKTKPNGHDASDLLLLVDQHAASERVILERLLTELCTPPQSDPNLSDCDQYPRPSTTSAQLDRPLYFEISAAEYKLFDMQVRHFADWGIIYQLKITTEPRPTPETELSNQVHRMIVRALPPGIKERCILRPTLLIELMRSEAWAVAETGEGSGPIVRAMPVQSNRSWLDRVGSCPKGILDMLNSRACRSAIMFNDELSVDACEQLLQDLSHCVFPFMCAHGRVSMVPIIDLTGWKSESVVVGISEGCVRGGSGTNHGLGLRLDNSGGCAATSHSPTPFAAAFKRWRQNIRGDLVV